MSRQQATAILDAAEQWKQRCLLDGGSLFTDERLWTRDHFEQLRIHVVENAGAGSDRFWERLRRLLDPAPPEAKRLWAEMTWAFYLIASEIPPEEKHDHIARVWEWSGSTLPEDHWALREEVLTGCSRWGSGTFANRWREVCGIVSAMIAWFSLPRPRRDALSDDAWGFAEWLAAGGLLQRRAFRHALLFLLFPASFEPVVVTGWKRQIVQGFARKWGEAPPANRDDLAVDRTLLRIRERLEADHSGEEIDFCRPPFEDVWRTDAARRPSSSSSGEAPAVSKGDDEAWFRKRFGEADVWAIAPGAGARRWTDFQQRGIAAIDYDGVGDLSEYESLDDIRQAAAESGLGDNPINHSLAMWDFAHEMRVGDILVAKRGVRAILGWGTVRGSYVYDPTSVPHFRPTSAATGRQERSMAPVVAASRIDPGVVDVRTC